MSSKIMLVANCLETVPRYEGYDYLGIDGGALLCMEQNIPMVCAVGDFDSISEENYQALQNYTEIVKLPTVKDDVDTERALRLAHEKGYEEILLVGVTGKRLDHFMVIYKLLQYLDFDFTIVDEYNYISRLKPGIHTIKKRTKYISFFPCDEQIITLRGMKYTLDKRKISEKDFYLSSNEIVDTFGVVETTGTLLCFETMDR